jgi:hypothetical protein
VFGEAFPAGAVMPLVLCCRAHHALLLTIAKVNIVTTSLKVTLRKLVMTQVFCGTRAWQNSNVRQARKHMVDYCQNRAPKLTPDNSR